MSLPVTQSASIELIGLALFGVIGLGYAIGEIMEGRTPIGRSLLRTRLERIGVRSDKGRLRGAVDGVEVDVEEIRSTSHPYLVTATSEAPLEGLTIASVVDGLRADRLLTGDPDFDAVVQICGPRLVILSILGEAERALLLQAVSAGWSFGQGRFSRLVRWPKEVVRYAEEGSRLARALTSAAQKPGLPIEGVAELYHSDPVAALRAQRLSLLMNLGGERGLELGRAALEDAQDEVRLVAAERLRHYPTVLDILARTSSDGLRRNAFQAILQAEDPAALNLAQEAFAKLDRDAPHAGPIGELVATHPFPGRLELARRWLETPDPRLRPHAYRVLGLEGDRSDLDRLADMPSDPELVRARALIRSRLVEQGHGGGQLALSTEGGELSVVPNTEAVEEDSTD